MASRSVPIVLLSAATHAPSWADELAIDGRVAKPFDPAKLPDRIRSVLGW